MIIFPLYSDWALLALRLVLGAILLIHGIPKLRNWKEKTAWFQSVGFKPGWLWGTIAGILEVFGGLALLIGFRTRLAALLFVLEFVAIIVWRLLRRDKFSAMELDLVILSSALVLLTVGGGMYALGRYSTFWGF